MIRKRFCRIAENHYLCSRVSATRPAPPELRQVLIEATVGGCSGAMWLAYPFFVPLRNISVAGLRTVRFTGAVPVNVSREVDNDYAIKWVELHSFILLNQEEGRLYP